MLYTYKHSLYNMEKLPDTLINDEFINTNND